MVKNNIFSINHLIVLFCLIMPIFNHPKQQFSNKYDFAKYCINSTINEYFRLNGTKNCALVYQCGERSLVSLKCMHGLVFDVEKQVCDWKYNVANCKQLRKSNTIFKDNNCKKDEFLCKSGECLPFNVSCNEIEDCLDGSDEIYCNVDQEQLPNCNLNNCTLPDCFCSYDGKQVPNDLKPETIPQMIMITFDDAVNNNNINIYEQLFTKERLNPNGCTIKGTFFVSNKFTNYTAVEYLHKLGHEIAVHSISHNSKEEYWKKIDSQGWAKEIAGSRLIIERFSNITTGSIVGMRSPMLRLGGSNQFSMLESQLFLYDSTIVAPLSSIPFWPYTLQYKLPHKCYGKKQKCPSHSHSVWEIVMNELDGKLNLEDSNLNRCSMIDQCSNIQDGQQFYYFLENNFKRHFDSNRAPLGLFFHASWLLYEDFNDVLINWIDEKLKEDNVYFVTPKQVIEWMQSPTQLTSIKQFDSWKKKCKEIDVSVCNKHNYCVLKTHELPGEILHLQTCMYCPKNYPWVEDPTGDDL